MNERQDGTDLALHSLSPILQTDSKMLVYGCFICLCQFSISLSRIHALSIGLTTFGIIMSLKTVPHIFTPSLVFRLVLLVKIHNWQNYKIPERLLIKFYCLHQAVAPEPFVKIVSIAGTCSGLRPAPIALLNWKGHTEIGPDGSCGLPSLKILVEFHTKWRTSGPFL